ncbi:hypothetical protein RIF29_16893 [Crotalaria pallida]|uniref:Thioredoxin domain-containing protein n=1 Tax=Crotalaria pallida TaxID=3830 RepID=A0AAN9IK52_CROPI
MESYSSSSSSSVTTTLLRSKIVITMLLWGTLSTATQPPSPRAPPLCPNPTLPLSNFILGFPHSTCSPSDSPQPIDYIPVTEGDEVSLHKALNMVHRNNHEYVAILFYASWCPFSPLFKPFFSIMSSLYPSVPHFAIQESSVKPSTLSKYGVHGFPTLFILNSTMRVRYRGSRTLASLISFYTDVTGIRIASLDQLSLEKIERLSVHEKHSSNDIESCPFSWARSPENLLRQETYLALATTFVVLRLFYIFFPTLLLCFQYAWKWVIQNVILGSLLEHPLVYLKRILQSFSHLKDPCKRSKRRNLQGGAMNAKAWASKSLATVSIGEGSTSRGQ